MSNPNNVKAERKFFKVLKWIRENGEEDGATDPDQSILFWSLNEFATHTDLQHSVEQISGSDLCVSYDHRNSKLTFINGTYNSLRELYLTFLKQRKIKKKLCL